ncbi:MAG: hypothetical protein J5854_07815 [Clostridia bacterium]|nr:hypothetical protein [Clostridia bacterium]
MIGAYNDRNIPRVQAKHAGTTIKKARVNRLSKAALDALEEILSDGSVKPADRLSAVKLTFDLISKAAERESSADNGILRVVFEGIDRELAE